MTILQVIIAACVAAGVPEKFAERIQKTFKIEKEESIEGCVALFKENILPAISEAEQAAQADAKAAAIVEYEKNHGLKDGKPIQNPNPTPPNPAIPDLSKLSPELQAYFSTQQKQIGDLTDLVKGLAISQQKNQKMELVRAKMKGKIDDDFIDDYIGRVNLDAENLDAEVEAQVKSYGDMAKKFITKAVAEGNYIPAAGGVSDSEFDSFLSSGNEDAPAFKGREL